MIETRQEQGLERRPAAAAADVAEARTWRQRDLEAEADAFEAVLIRLCDRLAADGRRDRV